MCALWCGSLEALTSQEWPKARGKAPQYLCKSILMKVDEASHQIDLLLAKESHSDPQ